jgi:hypothetical protein
MGATFSRITNWITGQTLTASALNAEIDNILNNLIPSGIDDESSTTTAMRATTDPYPASTESLATSLQGELQRIRYVIAQITGETYWYIDPDSTIAALYGSAIVTGTKAWFYQNTAPTGWTLDATPAVLAVKGGSNAYNTTGGTQAGTWALSGINTTSVYLTAAQSGLPAHTHTYTNNSSSGAVAGGGTNCYHTPGTMTTAANVAADSASTHNHQTTNTDTWRPLAQIGIICTKN